MEAVRGMDLDWERKEGSKERNLYAAEASVSVAGWSAMAD